MNEYTFPFNTCEQKTDDGIFAQPYSAIANIITCFIIIYFLLKTENIHSFLLLFSILVFELFHAFSHMIHIPGKMQTILIHFLAYSINFSLFNVFYHFAGVLPSYIFLIYIVCLVAFDIYIFFNYDFIHYFMSLTLIFVSLLFYYYPILPKRVQKTIQIIFCFVIIVLGLFLNEIYNCQNMLSFYSGFPYHVLIEIAGMYAFYVICSTFYKL